MFNEMVKSAVSLKAIYNNRKIPIGLTIAFFLVINIGFTFPFVIGLASSDQITIEFLLGENSDELLNGLDLSAVNQLEMIDGILVGNQETPLFYTLDNQKFVLDLKDTIATEDEIGFAARITEKYMYMNVGFPIYSDYQAFENAELSTMTNTEIFNYFLVNSIKSSIKQWFIPVFILFYLVFLSINTFFVLGMTALALLFRLGDRVKMSVFETLNVVIYASVMPTVVSAIASIFMHFLGLNLLIYNFGTLAIYMFVRQKYLNPIKRVPK